MWIWLTARAFARGFTIAPLSAASLASLPESELRMGSGLLSLNRGIASAGSVALAATLFQNRLAYRAIWLVQNQSFMPLGRQDLLQSWHATFERLGDFSQVASMKSLALLHRMVDMEAALHSYHDMFIIIGGVSAAGIIPALWMRTRKSADASQPANVSSPQASANGSVHRAPAPDATVRAALSVRPTTSRPRQTIDREPATHRPGVNP